MKYEPGDKIIVLLTGEEGTVAEIMSEKMVMIEVKGVRFPAYTDQVDFPYFKMFTEKKVPPTKKIYPEHLRREKEGGREKTGDGVSLCFIPVFDRDIFDDDVVEKFKVYLINHEDTAYTFTYDLTMGGASDFQLKNTLDPSSDFYLHDVRFEDMSDSPRFNFEFSLKDADKKKAPYFEASLKLKAKQLFKKIEELQRNNEPSFMYPLFDNYPNRQEEVSIDLGKLQHAGYRMYEASAFRNHMEPPRSVVDLHIEKLSDSWNQLSNYEILQQQLQAFEKYYDLAVSHYQSNLTVIHGIGEGKLRDEIHQLLKTKKEVRSFVNQYSHLYGYGATEIYFEYRT